MTHQAEEHPMKKLLTLAMLLALSVTVARAADEGEGEGEGEEAQEPLVGKAALVIDNGGHVGVIGGMVFTPDGKKLITVGHDYTIQEYDPSSGQRLRVIRPPLGAAVGNRLTGVALVRGAEKGSVGQVLAVTGTLFPTPAKNKDRSKDKSKSKGKAKARGVNRLFLLERSTGKIVSLNLKGLPPRAPPEAVAGLPRQARVASARGETILIHTRLGDLWRPKPGKTSR
jgi:hypothetical protein